MLDFGSLWGLQYYWSPRSDPKSSIWKNLSKAFSAGFFFWCKNKLFEQARFKLLLERFQNARFWVALRAPVWDRSLSTRHWEPRFGVDCMKVRHTPLYRRNVLSIYISVHYLSSNGCVPALGKFGNYEKSCKNDEKHVKNHRKPVRAPQKVLK